MMARQARRSGFESTLLYKKRINNEKRLWFCHSKLDKTFVWKFHSKTNKCVFSLKHSSSLIFEASRRLASGDKTQEHQHHYRWRCNTAAVDNSPSASWLDTKLHITAKAPYIGLVEGLWIFFAIKQAHYCSRHQRKSIFSKLSSCVHWP